MPENKAFKKAARDLASTMGEPYSAAAKRQRQEVLYVPGYGFRAARGGFRETRPVTVRRGGAAFTVTRVLGSTDATEVDVDLDIEKEIRPMSGLHRGPTVVAEIEAGGNVQHSRGMSMLLGKKSQLRMTFPPIEGRVRSLTVRLSGDLGSWSAEVRIKPVGKLARTAKRTSSERVTRNGVTVELSRVVFDSDRTVLRFLVSGRPPIRFIRGLATDVGPRRPPGAPLQLTDDLGNSYSEAEDRGLRPDPSGREQVVLFPAVNPGASAFALEVPWIMVTEITDPVEFDASAVGQELALGRYRIVIERCEVATGRMAEHYPMRVQFRSMSESRVRRFVRPSQVYVDGVGVAMSYPFPDPGGMLSVQVPNQPARTIRFAHADARIRGPWRITFSRDAGGSGVARDQVTA
ncbi:MAG TPA: hypothetical protein VF160_13865 [Candidatus Dormibacteraeota bacterium]